MKINEIKYNPNKKSIIIVEGPQGGGKTTFVEHCRENMPYTNLYRLYGTSDKTETGKAKAEKMYYDLLDYMKKLEKVDLNLLFDRTFFTEEVYCRLEYKAYGFSDVYSKLVEKLNDIDLNIFVVILSLKNTALFSDRLNRNKTKVKYVDFNIQNSINQQETYLALADELQKYDNINPVVVSTDNFEEAYKQLHELLPPLSTKEH